MVDSSRRDGVALCVGASLAAAGLVLIGWPCHKGPGAQHMLSVCNPDAWHMATEWCRNTSLVPDCSATH